MEIVSKLGNFTKGVENGKLAKLNIVRVFWRDEKIRFESD